MPFHKKKKTKNIDAFNSKTSTNGQVNDNGNPLLDRVEKFLLRKDNVAPAAKFIKRQQKLKDALNKLNEN
tara:strand:+ start:290 stop:499 length:210 start_codon:yes stop_codon:yes gene_type:complete